MANKVYIYKNQTGVRLTLTTDLDFSDDNIDVSNQQIEYVNPSGESGTWNATKVSDSSTTGQIYVDFSDTIKFDEEGEWKLRAKLTYSDGRIGYGDWVPYHVES